MSVGQTFQLLIIGGLILCYVVSAVASGYAAGARDTLPPDARERVYGMPYKDWQAKHQREASPAQNAAFEKAKPQGH